MRVCIALLSICLLVLPVTAQEDAAESHLLDLLRFVPDHVDNRNWIVFGDLQAWYESWGIEPIANREALMVLRDARDTDFLAFSQVMPFQAMPPDTLGLQYLLAEDMGATYGFDIFNTNGYLQAGQPPSMISVISTTLTSEAVAPSLTALEYTSQPLEPDGTLYSHGDDFETNIAATNLLRVGQLGNLNRIALLDGTMLIAKATDIIETSVEASLGDVPSLGDDASYQALATALEDLAASEDAWFTGALLTTSAQVSGDMVSAMLLNRDVEGLVETLEAQQQNIPALPAYTVVGFATLHKPGTSYSVIALVFPRGTDAQAAAESLEARIRGYTSIYYHRPFVEVLADHGARIVDARGVDAGRPVALLIIADDDPTFETSEDSPLAQTAVFNFWRFVTARDVVFLTPSMPE